MKFGYTILYVENVKITLDFYVKAFGFKQKMLHESGDYGELDTGGTVLAFSSLELIRQLGKTPQNADANTPTFELAFTTDNVDVGIKTAIEAGAKLISAPSKMEWGQTIAYVSDINGFLVEICTPMGS